MDGRVRRFYLDLRYNSLVILIVGSATGVAVDNFLRNVVEGFGWFVAIGAILLAVSAVTLLDLGSRKILNWWQHSRAIALGDPPTRRRGLIVLLGGGSPKTAPVAINHHQSVLEHVWFVETDATREIAGNLSREITNGVQTHSVPVEHHYDPYDTFHAIKYAATQARRKAIPNDALICDVTGGTSAMTVGATLACLKLKLDLEMVTAKFTEHEPQPQRPQTVIDLKLFRPEEPDLCRNGL